MEDTERIDRFIVRARQLGDLRLLKNWGGARLNVQWDHIKGGRMETQDPDDEDLRSYLMTLRLFLMEESPIYLYRVYSTAHQNLRSEELKRRLARARKDWSEFQRKGPFSIKLGNEEFTPERVTRLWINGEYFHESADARVLRQLATGPGAVISRHMLLDYVAQATNQIAYLLNVLRFARGNGLLDC